MLSSKIRHPPAPDVIADRADSVSEEEGGSTYVVDFCGKPGKDGAQGADGLNPSDPDGRPGEDGEDASPAQDCVILLNKIRSSPEGSVMKTLEFFAQGESREHPLSEHEVVYVDAKGAKGGNGGQGGNGLQGKIGEPGDVGRPGHPGEEGGVGGDGENGGRGGNGGNGGNAGRASCGGNVTIQAFDPTLFGLVEVNARGGAGSEGGLPGTPGQGGKGGRGGSGGRSGVVARRSLWCGGAIAERGSRGHDGLDGEDGVAGFPGKSSHHAPSHGVRFQHITGVPERFDVVREGKDRFQPQIYEFTLCDPDEDGIFTPESYAIVKDILVANVGGMPSPEGLQLWTHVSIEDKSEQAPAKLEATFVGAKGGGSKERAKHDVPVIKAEHIHIPEIQPGECRLIPGQLRIQLPPMRDVIRNEVYFSDVAVSIGVDVLGRCLPGSELKQTVAMRWPVEIDNVVAPKFAICDHIAQLQVSIRNYSNKPYGAGTDSGSLRLDVRSLNPAAIAVNGKEFDSSDIEDLPGHRTHTINIDISTLPDSHTLILTDAVLVYELFFNDRMIAQHDLTTKVLPAMSEQFTDVALVVHPEMDLADLYAWRLLCASLSLSVNLWSVELYGHLLGQVNIGWGNKCQALIVPTPVPLPNIVSQDDLLDMAKANRSFIAVGDIPGQYCLDHALLNYNPVLREAGADYFNGYPAGLERLNSNRQIGRQVERIRAKFDAQLPTCLHVAAVQTFPNHPVLLERQQGILSIYQAMVPRSAQFYAIHTEGKLLSSLLGQRKHVEIPNIGTLDQKWCRTPMEFEIVVELFSHLGSIVFAILQTIDIDKLSHLAMRAFRPLRWEANGVPIPAEHVIYAVLSNRMAREWDWGSWEFPLALSLESQVRDRPLEVPSLLFASVLKNALTKIRVPFVEKLIPSKTKHRYAVLKDIYERMLESMLKASDTDHQDVDREVMGFLNKTELVHGWPSADISSVTDRSQDVVLFDDDLLKLVRDRELSRAGIRRSLKLADVFNPGTQTWQAPDFIKKMDTTSDFEGVVNSIPFNQDKIADQGDKLPNKISEDTKEGAVSKKEEPVIKDKKQEPTSKEKFKEPGIKERMEEPATEESMEAPAIKEKMEKPAIEERMEEPVIKGRMEDPAIKGRMEKPAFEERMEGPAIKGRMEDPAIKERMEKPAFEERMEGPAIKGRMEDPAIKERMEKPAFEERMEGPAIKGRMEDPAIKERMEKPAFEERMEGPAITGSKGHLKDEPAYQNKKDEPVYQDKKDEPEYQDKKDQPGVKLPIEVTLPKESTNLEGRLPVIRPPE